MSQLITDCLEEIFEHLDYDGITLYSCLLVNRLWCKITVRIFWRNIRNYKTLITCLPNESKEILYENGISISNSKPPIFNYASFCKFLSVYNVVQNIRKLLDKQLTLSQNLKDNTNIVSQEIFKLLISQSSLRRLSLFDAPLNQIATFISHPGASDCLKDLSELCCDSNICDEFFYQLSQICHNIKMLYISFEKIISNRLVNLLSAQQNLKNLYL